MVPSGATALATAMLLLVAMLVGKATPWVLAMQTTQQRWVAKNYSGVVALTGRTRPEKRWSVCRTAGSERASALQHLYRMAVSQMRVLRLVV